MKDRVCELVAQRKVNSLANLLSDKAFKGCYFFEYTNRIPFNNQDAGSIAEISQRTGYHCESRRRQIQPNKK